MVITAMFSWALFQFVMKPLQLQFLQVLVFIGVVAFLVQALDTILKKTHRALHERLQVPGPDHHRLHHPRGSHC